MFVNYTFVPRVYFICFGLRVSTLVWQTRGYFCAEGKVVTSFKRGRWIRLSLNDLRRAVYASMSLKKSKVEQTNNEF